MKTNPILLLLLVFFTCLQSYAQTITGKVTNSSNTPIKNALVSLSNSPTIFAKTDALGAYSLTATVGAPITVAALGYETKINISTTAITNITLNVDPELTGNVYHINFDHMRAGADYTETELKRDFPVGSGAGFYDGTDPASNRVAIDPNESVGGIGSSIKVKFPANQLKTANSGLDVRIPLAQTYNSNNFQADELYLSYWIKFSDDFEFDKCGGKLPSLGGSDYNVRQNEWKGRIMWRNGGSIQFYMELPNSSFNISDADRFWGDKEVDNGDICTNEFTPYLSQSGWHNIELHYKFETPGQNDGYFEGWIDGDKGHKLTNASVFTNYRPSLYQRENLTINAILLSAFFGGSSIEYEHTKDEYMWFDEFKVSTTRINEYSRYNVTTDINSVDNATKKLHIYPNPTSTGIVTLNEPAEWSLYDITGKFISTGTSAIINTAGLTKGLYILYANEIAHKLIIE
jgi:hypothetical protein